MRIPTIIFYLISFLIYCKTCSGLKILGIFPLGSKSHFMMSGKLMKELALRGHEVSVINQFPQDKQIPNYTDIVVHSPITIGVHNLKYDDLKTHQAYQTDRLAKRLGSDLCDLLSEHNIQEILKTRREYYDVIVIEMLMSSCYLAFGQYFKAPIVGTVALKLPEWLMEPFGSPLNPSYMTSVFGVYGQTMTFWERTKNTLITHFFKYVLNYHLENQIQYVERHFGRKLSSIKELYDDVSVILVNTHHSLHGVKPTTPDIVEVGGLHVFDDDQQITPDLQTWLDESTDGCVLFTLGSKIRIETYPPEVIKIFYETFERIAPVRVIIKILKVDELPADLPKNVKALPWLPQLAVLRHKNIKLFITHGGLFSVQEAVVHRVPMIGLPTWVDQWANLKSCVDKKIAIKLELDETLTTDSLTNAITTVLTDPLYRENMERISKLFLDRPMNALDTAVYWIEYTARHRTVLKSPATKLTWWQLHLLDVYVFICLCLLIIFYIVKVIMCCLIRFTLC